MTIKPWLLVFILGFSFPAYSAEPEHEKDRGGFKRISIFMSTDQFPTQPIEESINRIVLAATPGLMTAFAIMMAGGTWEGDQVAGAALVGAVGTAITSKFVLSRNRNVSLRSAALSLGLGLITMECAIYIARLVH